MRYLSSVIVIRVGQSLKFLILFIFFHFCYFSLFIQVINQIIIFQELIIQQMEENIPYRKLKSLKPEKLHHTSERLLKPYKRHSSHSKSKSSIMNQNVTQYQYMLSNPHLQQNCIKWITNLRTYEKNKIQQRENIQYDIPSVFYKSTLLAEQRGKLKKQSLSFNVNTAEFSQFFGKQNKNISQSQMNFLTALRDMKNIDTIKVNHPHRFKNQGSKQNFNFLPKLLKKTAIKKLADINQNDYQQQLDGSHKFPYCPYKNVNQRNTALLKILSKTNSNVSLPCIEWQVGLRNY